MPRPKKFVNSPHCLAGVHCETCQDTSPAGRHFRLSLIGVGYTDLTESEPPACPNGRKPASLDGLTDDERELLAAAMNPQGWGDHVAAAIHKIGADRAYGMIRKAVGATGECKCNLRRQAINRLGEWVGRTFTPDRPASPPSP